MARNSLLNSPKYYIRYRCVKLPLFGPKVELKMDIDKDAYSPGEELKARILISSNKSVKMEEVRLELTCMTTVEYNVVRRYATTYFNEEDLNEFVREWKTIELVKIREKVLEKGVIPARDLFLEKSLTIPLDAPPTFDGTLIKTNWIVKTVINRKLRKDIIAKKNVTIMGHVSDEELKEPREIPYDLKDATILIKVPRFAFKFGETVSGEISIKAKKNLKFNEIRAELACIEKLDPTKILITPITSSTEFQGECFETFSRESLAKGVELEEDDEQKFWFNLKAPNIQKPMCETEYYKVAWFLNIVCSRRFKTDLKANIPIVLTNNID